MSNDASPTVRGQSPTASQTHMRWMIRRDLPDVLEIERASFEFPWAEDDFIRCLRQRNCIGVVAEFGPNGAKERAGYIVYELHAGRFHVLSFAVHPKFRRSGVGAAMLDWLKGRLGRLNRRHIFFEIRESNVPAQLFARAQGFRAQSILRSFYDDTGEDAYMFAFTVR